MPPAFRILINRIAVLSRRGKGGGFDTLDVAALIDGAGAHPAGSDVDAEEHARHSISPPFGTPLRLRPQIAAAIAVQHVWGIDVPPSLCNFLQDVKKFASGL